MWIIKNLSYKIDQFQISIPYLESGSHQITAIMGPSGAGKTTLFKLLVGQLMSQSWSWQVNGKELSNLPVADRKLGLVLQDFDLFPHLTVKENIDIILKSRRCDNPETRRQLDDYKKILRLESRWELKAQNLSGGERQRVSLLRALVSQSALILLDEPFSALDQDLKADARSLVKQALLASKQPVILITHDKEDCEALGARIVRMHEGTLVD